TRVFLTTVCTTQSLRARPSEQGNTPAREDRSRSPSVEVVRPLAGPQGKEGAVSSHVYSAADPAPGPAALTYASAGVPVSRSYRSVVAAMNSGTDAVRTSATAQPPNPAPVMRAPRQPGAPSAASTMVSSAGDETS